MQSLFIVSLPRSLSTLAYHVSRLSLGLSMPLWTTDGEIINNDRFVLYGGPSNDAGIKYTHPDRLPDHFAGISAMLDDIVKTEGRIYKDVVQPFVVAAWLTKRGLPSLRIRRPLADVAHSMLARRWLYPVHGAPAPRQDDDQVPRALLAGLLAAERALDAVPAVTVDYEDLIVDEDAIPAALAELYPRAELNRVRYMDADFLARRDATLARRETREYRDLESLARELAACPKSRIGRRRTARNHHENHQRHQQ